MSARLTTASSSASYRSVETGPHKELLRQNGYYASLVRRQHHGLIPNDASEAAA